MLILRSLRQRLTAERLGWFGAGLSLAAVGVVGYQVVVASLLSGLLPTAVALPGPQPSTTPTDAFPTRTPFPSHTPFPTRTPYPTRTPSPTRPPSPTPTPYLTRTPVPTRTRLPTSNPFPTRTPLPTRTSTPLSPAAPVSPDVLATAVLADPDAVVDAVATFAARTNQAFDALQTTPRPR
ncbi:MAG: hypothetical protein JOZ87_12655 [Chloroflexi bacterium]|nr:hypothetical protein [Chloroflexota bacterium]